MKKVLIALVAMIIISTAGVEAVILKGKLRLSGCKDAMYIATIRRYGPVPEQFKEQVTKDIAKACKELLGE